MTNGSYGDDEKRDHTYRVNIENGVPVACECPSDTYQDGACKHRVAVAIREPVLEAATADDSQDRVATDGGGLVVAGDGGAVLESDDVDETTTETEDCACSTLPGDYSCAACYIDGDAEWPDEEGDTHKSH
ncbi:SWIM zinc finger family protein [Saliphagus sp. LR7]|uniref:SWIM zinc finger family protein n=1 Tax=Saliphagus sp. LR7 TaxID=2282654 RepID=UPI001E395B97|nr:SWIM zinc finger family protein [Saliphagus sp. LR7]